MTNRDISWCDVWSGFANGRPGKPGTGRYRQFYDNLLIYRIVSIPAITITHCVADCDRPVSTLTGSRWLALCLRIEQGRQANWMQLRGRRCRNARKRRSPNAPSRRCRSRAAMPSSGTGVCRASAARRQDRRAHGAADAGGAGRAGEHSPGSGQSVGDRRAQAGCPSRDRLRSVGPGAGRGRGRRVCIHDLRHSWASRALALGESLPAIAKLLGHRQIRTTSRYAHLERDSVKASAARVADSITGDFLHGGGAAAASRSEQ